MSVWVAAAAAVVGALGKGSRANAQTEAQYARAGMQSANADYKTGHALETGQDNMLKAQDAAGKAKMDEQITQNAYMSDISVANASSGSTGNSVDQSAQQAQREHDYAMSQLDLAEEETYAKLQQQTVNSVVQAQTNVKTPTGSMAPTALMGAMAGLGKYASLTL